MKALSTTIDGATLRFEQSVPCYLAHRRGVSEVYVTDSSRVDDNTLLVAIQLPRAHSFWADRSVPYHDPTGVMEAARQATFVIVHRYLGVPIGIPFILGTVDYRVRDLSAFTDDYSEPFQGVVRLTLTDRREQQGVITRLLFRGEVLVNQTTAITIGESEVQFLRTSDYDMLRAFAHAKSAKYSAPVGPLQPMSPPIDPALVGRQNRNNIVIREGERVGDECQYPVIIDRKHPYFFEHSQDHVPGPLLLEAYRQAAIVTAQRTGALSSPATAMTSAQLAFSKFAEFDAALSCAAKVLGSSEDGSVELRVRLHQFDTEIGNGVCVISPC
jgi:hypothetical protein